MQSSSKRRPPRPLRRGPLRLLPDSPASLLQGAPRGVDRVLDDQLAVRAPSSGWTLLLVVGFDAASRHALRCAQHQALSMSMGLRLLHVVPGEPGQHTAAEDRALRSTLRAWAEFEGGLLLTEEALSIARGAMAECILQECHPGVALVVAAQAPEPGVTLVELGERLRQGCPCPVSLRVPAVVMTHVDLD